MIGSPDAQRLISDFWAFSRAESALAVMLISAGAVLEGVGVVMLVPIAGLIIADGDAGGLASGLFAALGLETVTGRLWAVLAAFTLVIGLRFAVILWRDDLLTRLQLEFVADLRTRAFRQLARAPWHELARLQQDTVGHALARDVERAGYGATLFVHGGIAAVMLVIQGALALALAPVVTLTVVALGFAVFRSLHWLRERSEHQGKRQTEEDLSLYRSMLAFLRGLKPAKAHGIEARYVTVFDDAAARLAAIQRASALDFAVGRLILQTAAAAIAIVVILVGVLVVGTPPESLAVSLIILVRLYGPVQTFQNSFQAIRHAAPGYRATREIAGPTHVAVLSPPIAEAVPLERAPHIVFDQVVWHTAETGARAVIDGVSAEIPAGQVTALIGESGAGKTTFCDLAIGLLQPTAGEILLDGARLDEALTARLRASVGYVGQEAFLLDTSLRNNLAWGCGPLSDAEIWAALEKVGAAELARGLQGGLDGTIRTEGTRFSGGERQRLRLARAMLRRPRFLVLDEATNALDLAAEQRVLEAILAANEGVTVLFVSHRPSVLRFADHVIMLEAGRVAKMGGGAEFTALWRGSAEGLAETGPVTPADERSAS